MTFVVDYFFSPISGYAYLGHKRFIKLIRGSSAKVNFMPLPIGKIFESNETLPPAKQSPSRLAYRQADMKRWAEFLNLPLNVKPKHWPVPDLLASKCIIAAPLLGLDQAMVSSLLLEAVWAKDVNISSPDELSELFHKADIDALGLISKAGTNEIDEQLQLNVDTALSKGVFGSPTYIMDNELFFGQDRLNFLETRLKG